MLEKLKADKNKKAEPELEQEKFKLLVVEEIVQEKPEQVESEKNPVEVKTTNKAVELEQDEEKKSSDEAENRLLEGLSEVEHLQNQLEAKK